MELNGKKVVDVVVDGVDIKDYPDFCDAYISSAQYEDGTELTWVELEELERLYPGAVHEAAHASFH